MDVPVAIVTGGAQGIGAAICKALLKKGYKVCVADLQESKGRQFVEELQGTHGSENVTFSLCDVTKEADYKNTFEFTIEQFQNVDVLVNNAGIILEQNPRKVLDVNLMGPIIGCQTALKYMGRSNGGEGGMVINTASMAGFFPHSAMPVYVASKHGVVGLTRSYGLPQHFDREGIIFSALCPTYVDTDLLKSSPDTTLVRGLDFSARKDLLSPDFVAEGALKLLEDRINGSTLVVAPIHESGMMYLGVHEELKGFPFE